MRSLPWWIKKILIYLFIFLGKQRRKARESWGFGFRREALVKLRLESTRKEKWKSVWSLFCVVEESEHIYSFIFLSFYICNKGWRTVSFFSG